MDIGYYHHNPLAARRRGIDWWKINTSVAGNCLNINHPSPSWCGSLLTHIRNRLYYNLQTK
jgi:hypothetical protein